MRHFFQNTSYCFAVHSGDETGGKRVTGISGKWVSIVNVNFRKRQYSDKVAAFSIIKGLGKVLGQ